MKRLLEFMKRKYASTPDGGHGDGRATKVLKADESERFDASAASLSKPPQSPHWERRSSHRNPSHVPDADREPLGRGTRTEAISDQTPESPHPYLFADDGEQNYTEGPSRMVAYLDGAQDCAAILLNSDLSQKLQKFVKTQGRLGQLRSHYEHQLPVIVDYRQWAGNRLYKLDDKAEALGRISKDHPDLADYADEAEALRASLDVADDLEGDLDRMIPEAEQAVLVARLEAGILLEQVFRDCGIDQNLSEPLDLVARLEPFVDPQGSDISFIHRRGSGSVPSWYSRDSYNGGSRRSPSRGIAPPGPEQILRDDYWRAYDVLRNAQVKFDQRGWDITREGPRLGETLEDFDIRLLYRKRELTNALVQAEQGFAKMKERAVVAGIHFPNSDLSSGFADQSDDGEGSGAYQDMSSVPTPKIWEWLEDVESSKRLSAGVAKPRPSNIDDWDCRNVGVSDSCSVVAEGTVRRRIDKWQYVCEDLTRRREGIPPRVVAVKARSI